MSCLRKIGCLLALIGGATSTQAETINIGRTFQGFSAADLDTTPTFAGQIQGINMGNVVNFGALTANETIGGVTLLQQANAALAGIVVNPDPSGIAGQVFPSLGATADDDALERVFNFGEFATAGPIDVTFPVDPAGKYKVQVLMFEFISLTRTFDIKIDDVLAADELSVIQNDGKHQDALSGVSSTSFTVYEAIVDATGPSLKLTFDFGSSAGQLHPLASQDPINFGTLTIADNTPFIHGIIVERVPEPSTVVLFATIGVLVASTRVRRRMC